MGFAEDMRVNDEVHGASRSQSVNVTEDRHKFFSVNRKPSLWAPIIFQIFLLIAWSEALSAEGTSRDLHLTGVTAMQVLWIGWVAEVVRRRRHFASLNVR